MVLGCTVGGRGRGPEGVVGGEGLGKLLDYGMSGYVGRGCVVGRTLDGGEGLAVGCEEGGERDGFESFGLDGRVEPVLIVLDGLPCMMY